jgi:hypothetical protein
MSFSIDFVAPRVTTAAAYIIAMRNGIAGNDRFDRCGCVTERTPFDVVIVVLAVFNPQLRIQPTLPAPVDLVDDVDRQGLSHGDPPRGGSTIGLSAIGGLSRVPMILATWTLSATIASFFGPVASPIPGQISAEEGYLVGRTGPALK